MFIIAVPQIKHSEKFSHGFTKLCTKVDTKILPLYNAVLIILYPPKPLMLLNMLSLEFWIQKTLSRREEQNVLWVKLYTASIHITSTCK